MKLKGTLKILIADDESIVRETLIARIENFNQIGPKQFLLPLSQRCFCASVLDALGATWERALPPETAQRRIFTQSDHSCIFGGSPSDTCAVVIESSIKASCIGR